MPTHLAPASPSQLGREPDTGSAVRRPPAGVSPAPAGERYHSAELTGHTAAAVKPGRHSRQLTRGAAGARSHTARGIGEKIVSMDTISKTPARVAGDDDAVRARAGVSSLAPAPQRVDIDRCCAPITPCLGWRSILPYR